MTAANQQMRLEDKVMAEKAVGWVEQIGGKVGTLALLAIALPFTLPLAFSLFFLLGLLLLLVEGVKLDLLLPVAVSLLHQRLWFD